MQLTTKAKLENVRIGHLRALGRFFRDPKASLAGKLFMVLTVIYVVSPIDAVPDIVPVLGWLDDVGVIGAALGYLSRVLGRYRHPVIDVTAQPAPASYSPTSR